MATKMAQKATKPRVVKTPVKSRGVFEKIKGSGIWWIRYFDANGQKHREKVGRKSDAISLYQQRKTEIRAGAKMPANLRRKGETLGTVLDRALAWYVSHRPKSVRSATTHLTAFKDSLGDRVAAELTPRDVDEWISSHTEWSPATMNRYKTTLSRALQVALVSGHLQRNVARLVTSRKEDNSRVRWLTDGEETKLLKTMSPELTDIVLFAMDTGARKGEQFSLTWDSISFKRRAILLTKTKNGSDREIPMTDRCFEILERLHKDKSETHNRVFQARWTDAPLKNPRKAFDLAVQKAGIKDFHYHDLRHTFASRLVMVGVDLYTVSKLLGHSSIGTTQRYSHLSQERLAQAVSVLNARKKS